MYRPHVLALVECRLALQAIGRLDGKVKRQFHRVSNFRLVYLALIEDAEVATSVIGYVLPRTCRTRPVQDTADIFNRSIYCLGSG